MLYASVLSRQEIEALDDLGSVPVISVVGGGTKSVKLNNPLKVLTLVFDDVVTESLPKNSHLVPFNREQAKDVLEFIRSLPDEINVLVHCEAGISRSAGIVRGLEFCGLVKWENFDRTYWDIEEGHRTRFHPNPTVVSVLIDEYKSTKSELGNWISQRENG